MAERDSVLEELNNKVASIDLQQQSNETEWCCESLRKSIAETSSEFLSIFEVTYLLGCGSFGVVYKVKKIHVNDPFEVAYWPDCGHAQPLRETVFAVKIIPEGRLAEASYAAQLCHPHIVSCYNVWAEDGTSDEFKSLVSILNAKPNTSYSTDTSDTSLTESATAHTYTEQELIGYIVPPYLLMQFEFCTQGTLDDFLLERTPDHKNPLKHYAQNQNLFTQMLEAILFMENKEIVHGDLKPNNIFLTRRRNGALIAKIGDFGLNQMTEIATAVKEPKGPPGPPTSKAPEITHEALKDKLNSRNLYRSPEQAKISCFRGQRKIARGSFHKSDIYSLGLMFIPMLIQFPTEVVIQKGQEVRDSRKAREAVFMAMQEELSRKKDPSWRFLESKFPQEFKWIEKMVDHDMAKRPTATEVKQWTLEGPPGYEIDYGEISQTIKAKLENTLKGLKTLEGMEMDEVDTTLKGVKRRFYFHLLELVYEALISLPVDDELVLEIMEYHKEYMDSPPSSSQDKLYLYKNFVPKLEAVTGLENLRTLKWIYTLAISQIKESPEEAFKNYEKIRNTKSYEDLDLLDPFKIEVESTLLFIKCPKLDIEDYTKQAEYVYKMDELEIALRKCEQIYLALTNISKRDIFSDWITLDLFIVKLKILAILYRTEEAEDLFVETLSTILDKNNDDESFNIRPFGSFFICYSQYLERQKRYDESINILEYVCKFENQKGRLDALNRLAVCHLKMNNFDVTHPKFKEVVMKIAIEQEIPKAQGLLPNPEQLQLQEGEVTFDLRNVDFEFIQ